MSKVTQELSSKGGIQTQRDTQEKKEVPEARGPSGSGTTGSRCAWDLVVVAYKVIREKQRPDHKKPYQFSCGG